MSDSGIETGCRHNRKRGKCEECAAEQGASDTLMGIIQTLEAMPVNDRDRIIRAIVVYFEGRS